MQSKSPDILSGQKFLRCIIFFHPDFTVGFGVSPNHALRLVGYTTGRESHPALKISYLIEYNILHIQKIYKSYLLRVLLQRVCDVDSVVGASLKVSYHVGEDNASDRFAFVFHKTLNVVIDELLFLLINL